MLERPLSYKLFLTVFIKCDSYSLLLFKLSNNLYIITGNFESFPFASLTHILAILCLTYFTSGCLPSLPYIIHLDVIRIYIIPSKVFQ